MKQAKISLEYLPIGLRSSVVVAPHSQNPFEHQQRRTKGIESVFNFAFTSKRINSLLTTKSASFPAIHTTDRV